MNYSCASTDVPVVSISLNQNKNRLRILEGEDVYFSCSIRSSPPPTSVQWYHNVSAALILFLSSYIQLILVPVLYSRHLISTPTPTSVQWYHNVSAALNLFTSLYIELILVLVLYSSSLTSTPHLFSSFFDSAS